MLKINSSGWKLILRVSGLGMAALLTIQTAYYSFVYGRSPSKPPSADLVLVYSGGHDPSSFVPQWPKEGNSPLFLFSGWEYSRAYLERDLHLGNKMVVEDKARTTEQNARYCAPLILKAGVHSVVLALPWYHLPRALFLTRLYLVGKGVAVTPFSTTPIPENWWLKPIFQKEFFKFWGSLGRVFLASFGWETGPSRLPKLYTWAITGGGKGLSGPVLPGPRRT